MSVELAVVFGLSSISFTFAFLSVNLTKEKHGLLQFFFLIMSLYMMGTTLSVTAIELRPTNASLADMLENVNTIIWFSAVFVLFYFIMLVVISAFNDLWNGIIRKMQRLAGIKKKDEKPTAW